METKKQAIITEKDLNLLWRVIKSNWHVPIILVSIFYGIGSFYAYKQVDISQASTQLLLNKNEEYYGGSVVQDASAYYIDNSNEMKVITSYDLMKETVTKLKDRLQVSYYIIGRVKTTEHFSGNPFDIKINNINPEWYEAVVDFKILDFDHYEMSMLSGEEIKTFRGQFDKELINIEFNILVKRTPIFTKELMPSISALNYQVIIHSIDWLIANFQVNMLVENPEYTNILKVSIDDIIPERAVLVLDTLNKVYTENSVKSKIELNEKTISYIDRQLHEITDTLKNIEDTMQWYKESKNILDLTWEKNDYFSKLSVFDNLRSGYQLQIEALNDLEKYIIEDKDPQFLPPSVLVFEKAGFMNTAVDELYRKQLDINKVQAIAKENYPGIAELRSSIKKLKQDLLVYISNTRKATFKTIENLNEQTRTYVASIKTIPGKQRDILNIQRKVNVSENLYNFLLERRANTRIARASIIPTIKVIEQPRDVGIVKPDKQKIIKDFAVLGLILAVSIIIIRAFFFSKIKTVNHLKELTELPIIGVLPYMKSYNNIGIAVDEEPNSKISEAFRNLRTNLQYANIDAQARSFLVTSFSPGEGKTFSSINLATILAKTGKKVALLELDLHKPRVSRIMGIQPKIGISTYLAGLNTIEEITEKTIIENLFCIYAGPIPPNPSELVLAEKMKELILYTKNNYDYVIIDTPPAGLLSDAIYLMQFVDASLFVMNTKVANKKVVTFVQNLVITNNLKNMFLILNGVRSFSGKYYYKGYGNTYGYGYGYGYGYSNAYGYGKGYGYGYGSGKSGSKKLNK